MSTTEMLKRLSSGSNPDIMAALRELEKCPDPELTGSLQSLLESDDVKVRYYARKVIKAWERADNSGTQATASPQPVSPPPAPAPSSIQPQNVSTSQNEPDGLPPEHNRSEPAPAISDVQPTTEKLSTPAHQPVSPIVTSAPEPRQADEVQPAISAGTNPFQLLGATPHDNRRRIVALAEEKSLILDAGLCTQARAELTNPRSRLSAELAWFPGTNQEEINSLLQQIAKSPDQALSDPTLTPLTRANLGIMTFTGNLTDLTDEILIERIVRLCEAVDAVNLQHLLETINEDRNTAGFPAIQSLSDLDAEWPTRRQQFLDAMRTTILNLPQERYVSILTQAIELATKMGEKQAPLLLDELIDAYEVIVRSVLDEETKNVTDAVARIRSLAPKGEPGLRLHLEHLDKSARRWDVYAQPMQVSHKSRGREHEVSQNLGYEIRSLSIDLYNEHNMLDSSKKINEMLQDVFAELPEMAEQLNTDASKLADLGEQQKATEQKDKEWRRAITWDTEWGIWMFKKSFSISPHGIDFNKQSMKLEDVQGISWGATRHYTNGIPTGTTYKVKIKGISETMDIQPNSESDYDTMTDKLWRAVGFMLMLEMVNTMKKGVSVHVGEARISDRGVSFTVKGLLGFTSRDVSLKWSEVSIWSAEGSCYLGSSDNKKDCIALSYQDVYNVHVLDYLIRAFFKSETATKPSELFD